MSAKTPQNGQTHLNNSSAFAELLERNQWHEMG